MTITESDLGSIAALTRALGITTGSGSTNSAWFADPLGTDQNPTGLSTILGNDDQRTALVEFVDEVLGPPDADHESEGAGETTWLPLFTHPDPQITVYAVLTTVPGAVHVGVGVDAATGESGPRASVRLQVPLFRVPREGTPLSSDGVSTPTWLLLGRPQGRIGVHLDATFTDDAPVPGEGSLRGVSAGVEIPTDGTDDLGFEVTLRDLQLPGATAPTSPRLDIDSLDDLGEDVFEFVVGLLRAQLANLDATDPALRIARGVAEMLGLGGSTALPELPLADLPSRGVDAIAEWIADVLADESSRDAWLDAVALLTSGTARPAEDAVSIDLGPATVTVGVRVTPGPGGHLTAIPWLRVSVEPHPGAHLGATADVMRIDTATATVTAVPSLDVSVSFGSDAPAPKLLATGPVRIRALRVGVGLDQTRRPTPRLTLHDVQLAAGTGNETHHDVLDLSSPGAALAAVDDVVGDLLSTALDDLGQAGELVATLIGVDPPSGVTGVAITGLMSDPLGTLAAYWRSILASTPATEEVLGDLAHLLRGAVTPVTGAGTGDDPWRLPLHPDLPVAVEVSRLGEVLTLTLAAGVEQDLVGTSLGDLVVGATMGVDVASVDLSSGTTTFVSHVSGALTVNAAAPVSLPLHVARLEITTLGVDLAWSPQAGLLVTPGGDPRLVWDAEGLPTARDLPLPIRGDDGGLLLSADWDDVELVIGRLLQAPELTPVHPVLDLLGWDGTGPRLRLADLLADPAGALRTWVGQLSLDCSVLHGALSAAAFLLSAGSTPTPLGHGRRGSPWRVPVGGHPRAPGISIWSDPPCPPPVDWGSRVGFEVGQVPDGARYVAALRTAGAQLPDIDDLLMARPSLATGLDALVTRATATDGLVGAPATLPGAVTSRVLFGYGFEEARASAVLDDLPYLGMASAPATRVHVTTDRLWWQAHDPAARIDATTGTAETLAALPASDQGPFFVLLPGAASQAGAAGSDGVAGQAARLESVLRDRTTSVTAVAHGEPAAACLRAASRPSMASVLGAVVTVGAPWSVVPTTTFVGHGGDALAFLSALAGPLPVFEDDHIAHGSGPGQRCFGLLRRMRQERVAAQLPSAAAEAIRPGLAVHVVVPSLRRVDVCDQLTALMRYAVDTRAEALATGWDEDAETADDDAAQAGSTGQLQVGLALPPLDLVLGPISVGVGADVSLVSVAANAGQTPAPVVSSDQVLTLALRFGVTDGWLVGGPGATQRDVEARWLEVVLGIPLQGTDADTTCTLVLHEASVLGVVRQRWVISADDPAASLALPEVKIALGAIASRLFGDAPALATLLVRVGVLRDGGLDPTGIDRLLFDTRALLADALADPAGLADDIRSLLSGVLAPGSPASGPVVRLGEAAASVDVDLATGAITALASVGMPGLAAVSASATISPAGARATMTIGTTGAETVVPRGAAGGVALRLAMDAASPDPVSVDLDVAGPVSIRTVPIYPTFRDDDLLDALCVLLPAVGVKAVVDGVRAVIGQAARDVLDAALDALGMLDPADSRGQRAARLPTALLLDPAAHLRASSDPLAAAVAVLDAIGALVVPDDPGQGWAITDGVRVSYAVIADRLHVTIDTELASTIDSRDVALSLGAGLSIAAGGQAAARVDLEAAVDHGYGIAVRVGTLPSTPVALDLLRPAPGTPIRIHPAGPGLGSGAQIAGAAAEMAVVVALNALIERGDAGSSTIQRVGMVARHLATALDLVADPSAAPPVLDPAQVRAFAADPAGRLLARLPALTTHTLAAIATAVDTSDLVATTTAGGARIAWAQGGASSPTDRAWLELDGTTQQVVIGGRVELDDGGVIRLDALRVGATGVSVSASAAITVDLGTVQLFPVLTLHAGVGGPSVQRLLGVGLATTAAASESVQVRWALDATAPQVVAVTDGLPSTDLATVAARCLGLAIGIASGLVADQIGTVISDTTTANLQDVVFTGGTARVDPTFVEALFDVDALLARLHTLLWNCATGDPLTVTIDEVLQVGLTAVPRGGGREHLGLRISIEQGEKVVLATGSPTVCLEVNSDWIISDPDPGISILVLEGTRTALELEPGIVVAGLGVSFTSDGEPLVDTGSLSIDGIAVRIYGEASAAGTGGGAQVVLDGLSIAPGGGGGSNGMANDIMNDVGESSDNARPTFSPSVAVQQPPGQGMALSVRAGDEPGPWWVVIQRQIGPLNVDRIGFNSIEEGGRVTRISLLFTGSIELFGLTAAVDQLSISWTGGDVLSISSWSVDLMGLAVSADLSGVSISGGLLKLVEGDAVSYLGMLTGRFGTYGLSVFGGFSQAPDGASFFIFGGFNGPIGGPPAFFLTGIAGGLGINRGLVVPDDLSQFGSYPFIAALNPAAPQRDPMDQLRELAEYFPHQIGNFWFAGGVSFTCFALIDGIAVLAVSFGSGGLDIMLFGLARMALPRPGAALVSIELALLIRFSLREGVFMIRAQLTDNSWLLYPEVKLTGGFAFAIWWKGPLAGQFVLTLGGYHPSFQVEGYPDVPRLGIEWRISDALVIKGGSYFALTSEALMAGQSVEASLDKGWVWASVTFGADGIVYFDPFRFDVRAYARISAGIEIDLWLTTLSLSITIGAEIHVWGPDFAGQVTFEIGPAEVPIRFGSRDEVEPATQDWGEFVAKYLEQGTGTSARALSAITGRGTLPTSTRGETAAPSADGSADLPYRVFAEFEITITTSIPTRVISAHTTSETIEPTLAGATSELGLSPMGLRDLQPVLTVALARRLSESEPWVEVNDMLTPLAAGLGPTTGPATVATTAFPLGVFGAPHPSAVDNTTLPDHEVVVSASRVTLVAGYGQSTPGPLMDYYRVDEGTRPLPLRATRLSRAQMVNLGAAVPVLEPSTPAEAILAAQHLIFDHGEQPHSAAARAGFVSGRSAPPMFGTLTDGLAADNGADGSRERLPFAPTQVRQPRRPIVTGYLDAGALAATRPAPTTVSDGRLKRRIAPRLDSARSRLSRRLAVSISTTTPPAAVAGSTVAATTYVPRTAAATSGAAHQGSRLTGAALQGLVGGLGSGAGMVPRRGRARRLTPRERTHADQLSRAIHGGDVVVLSSLDARYDGDTTSRPHLSLEGRARMLALAGRSIVADVESSSEDTTPVPVPAGTTLIAVHCGGDLDPEDGWPGWHEGSRIARLGERAALGAGCALSVDRIADARSRTIAWEPAQSLTGGARSVTTRFTRPVHTLAIALTGPDGGEVDLARAGQGGWSDTALRLGGARVADDPSTGRAPHLVVLAGVSVLVYRVEPEQDATAVSVTVGNGPAWAVTGMVGCDADADTVAERIAAEGLRAVLAKVTAATGSARISWADARRSR